ncbi:hypothetical protein [Porphyrobacter sp. CACIAM 03H1]|uniref:hypothetical protein n=1 Tax=Porphyrobacter sp. CACIAM 03H1 TaxID=2003315 RepID=UPI0012FE2F86|nr:hypothetical protein [Porphyrobacter sp. CACIAM 03H1]
MDNKEGWKRVALAASAIWILSILFLTTNYISDALQHCSNYLEAPWLFADDCYSGLAIVILVVAVAATGLWLIRYVYRGFFDDQ